MKTCKICNASKSELEFYKNGKNYRPECKDCTDIKQRASAFGITVQDLQKMYIDQDFRCAICREPCEVYKNLSIDHDHKCCSSRARSCGKCVRGLLCAKCNHGLGSFRDNPEFLRRAIVYLSK